MYPDEELFQSANFSQMAPRGRPRAPHRHRRHKTLTSVTSGSSVRPLQNGTQRHAAPFCMPDSSRRPLHSLDLLTQKRAAIAGTFQRHENRARRHRIDLLPGQIERPLDAAIDGQTPALDVDLWRLIVTSNEEPPVGSDPTRYLGKGRFTILRRRAQHLLLNASWRFSWPKRSLLREFRDHILSVATLLPIRSPAAARIRPTALMIHKLITIATTCAATRRCNRCPKSLCAAISCSCRKSIWLY